MFSKCNKDILHQTQLLCDGWSLVQFDLPTGCLSPPIQRHPEGTFAQVPDATEHHETRRSWGIPTECGTLEQRKDFLNNLCRTVKVERGAPMPDVNYFTTGTDLKASDIVVHHRDCRGCKSNAVSCTNGSLKVYLEYIVMEFFQDTEVTTVRNKWQKNCPQRTGCHQSNTNQEFILGEYIVDNFPDVILLFSSNHDKGRHGLQTVRAYIDFLKMIINMYVPKRTQVFWFSKISETLQKKPKFWRNVTFDGKSTNKLSD